MELKILTKQLIEAKGQYEALLTEIICASPELFEELTSVKDKLEGLESAVKALLKDEKENFVSGPYVFKVSSTRKEVLDLESTVFTADKKGHLDILLQYGVLKFTGDPSKIPRLPEKIRSAYKEFVSTTTSKRVSMPKSLKRSW